MTTTSRAVDNFKCSNPDKSPVCQGTHWARGLCRSCYGYALRRGELGGYQKEAAADRDARLERERLEAHALHVAWDRATTVRPGRGWWWGPARA